MPNNIAGYIDRSYVKGSTYRYAGCPIPTVFTGNINVVSEDLLVKAMVAVSGTAQGDFPGTVADRFLIQTIKYGNDVYLQTAVTSDGSEYRRIYTEVLNIEEFIQKVLDGRIGIVSAKNSMQ